MKKIIFLLVFAFGLLLNGKLNSYGNSEPFDLLVSGKSYEVYLKYKNVISTYVHTQDLPDWAQMNPDKDGYEGTSTLELYDYLKTLNPEPLPDTIIVAVMDTGVDIDHPELKNKIWQNEKETDGISGVDDDGNGFVDDIHGWNFLGSAVNMNLEVARELKRLNREGVSASDRYYKKVKQEFESKYAETKDIYGFAKETLKDYLNAEKKLQSKNYPVDPDKLREGLSTLSGEYKDAANMILMIKTLYGMSKDDVVDLEKDYKTKMNCLFDTTNIGDEIGDDPEVLKEKNYGDNNVFTKGESHATHVAGIISSSKKGIGQAPFVKIMCLRVVPDEGDERDKDVANGIFYAVDNGAKVINLSAGKYFSPNWEFVVEAIKYAEKKGVVFVVASGNEGTDIAEKRNFPPKYYSENGEIKFFSNMITVGANTWLKKWDTEKDPDNLIDGYDLCAPFSNYSGKVVDLFAPGMEINSTVPGGGFKRESGTSMAAPEVTGIAAIIRGYFPQASASDVKLILTGSVRKYDDLKVKVKDKSIKVLFSSLSKSGGVIDAMNAYKLAKEKFGM